MKKSLALFAALLLSACVATPSTEPQTKQLEAQSLGLGSEASPRVPDDWWKAFQDPQADRLAAAVVGGNPTLQAALARIRAAQAQLSVENANDLPQVTLDGEEQRELFSKDFIYPPPYAGSWRWSGSLQANLNWSIDFWGKQADEIARAHDLADAARWDAEAARLALSGAFAQAYINLLLAYENGDIVDRAVAEREEILRLTQNRFNAGLENPQALEQAKALLAVAKIYQMKFAAQREIDVHAIVALTGQGASAYAAITRPAPQLDLALPLPDMLPADFLARRPDIMAARARVEASAKGREAAHAAFYPNINLAAFIGFQAIGLSNLIGGNSLAMGAGPALHLPIFDAGKIRAEYAGATAQLDESVADYNGAVVGAIKQTEDAMTEVKSLKGQRAEQQAALASAEKSFAFAQTRYQSGLSNQLTLLNAEGTVLFIRQQSVSLIAEEAAQRITLMLSVGGGFNPTDKTDIARKDQ